jgi:hypothetical protein
VGLNSLHRDEHRVCRSAIRLAAGDVLGHLPFARRDSFDIRLIGHDIVDVEKVPRYLWRDRHSSIERLIHELRKTITEGRLDKISIHSALEHPDHISPIHRHGEADESGIEIRCSHGLHNVSPTRA